ncbi:MAG: MBL fold metallo-hydrolase [Clostridia bacterium]|nr:MBL fold metallo-hydrolase [Clostridia bacterium]
MTEILPGIFSLKIPFEAVYTTVFFVETDQGVVMVDCASYDTDVDEYILPFLKQQGMEERLCGLVLTHSHLDHAGGSSRLTQLYPNLPVCAFEPMPVASFRSISDGEVLFDRLRVVHLPGHTLYSVGYLDLNTRSLLTGDCLQLRGVGKYINGVKYPELYRKSLNRIRQMMPSRLIASHDYVPLGSTAEGEVAIRLYLDECENALSC